MEAWNSFERPVSLQEGKHSFLGLTQKSDYIPVLTQVTFFGYT